PTDKLNEEIRKQFNNLFNEWNSYKQKGHSLLNKDLEATEDNFLKEMLDLMDVKVLRHIKEDLKIREEEYQSDAN
ncbi:MAG: hypothetical protein ACFFG0_08005, partial [Candidatus Thorarchaeota archaeon]